MRIIFCSTKMSSGCLRAIAKTFGKNHKEVLRDIQNLDCSKEFTQRNFALSSYKDKSGKRNKEFEITKDGVVMLIMGYTGAKAMQFKETYIKAFNQMEEVLTTRMYGESHTLTEIRKAVTNKLINEMWRGEARLYKLNELRKYLGYSGMNAGEKERYKGMFSMDSNVIWCLEDYVLLKIRSRTMLNQRKETLAKNEYLIKRAEELKPVLESAIKKANRGGSNG